MRIGFFWLGCVAIALCMSASSAQAQQWLSDRKRAEGHGIRAGQLELHPGIGTEIGYDSNVFLSEKPEDSAILRVAPSLYLSTLSNERLEGEQPIVAFRGGVTGTLKHYFSTDRGTDMGVGEDAKLTWNASSIFALQLFQDYKRAIDPFGEAVGGPTVGANEFDRDQLGGGTRLQLSTRGHLLKGGLGYRIDWDNFESAAYNANDSLKHTISADTSWEFLPKTAIFWNGSFMLHDYTHDNLDAIGERNGSKGVTNNLGLNGAITERISFTLAGGYSAAFFDNNVDSELVTAQVEARWRFLEQATWSLGYDRTLMPSFQGNSMHTDRIKTGVQALFGGVFALGAKAEFAFVTFGDDADLANEMNTTGSRDDKHLLLNLSGEYRFVDWFAVTGEVGYLHNFTDFVVITTTPDASTADPNDTVDAVNEAKYERFEAWLGVRAFL